MNEGDDYYEVNLCTKDKNVFKRIHRLVAEAFVNNPDNLPEVNHIDGNKHNNCAENLEWCSRLYNVRHSLETGLRSSQKGTNRAPKQVRCIETGQVFKTVTECAKAFNISRDYLSDRLCDKKECHGYHFEMIVPDLRVKCLDTGEVFNTAIEAQEKFGTSDITESIKRRTCVDGWTFCFVRDNVDESAYLKECRDRYSKWPRANKRWEDNDGN